MAEESPKHRVPLIWILILGGMLVLGIQLGRLPIRYRRELWQVQGAAVGAVVGFLIGRATAR
jgi:hypothetical protein